MNVYRGMLNRFALNTLAKNPEIPDFHLMVGSAEELSPLPLLVYENARVPSEVIDTMKVVENKSATDIEQAIANNNLEVNDLNWNIAMLGV